MRHEGTGHMGRGNESRGMDGPAWLTFDPHGLFDHLIDHGCDSCNAVLFAVEVQGV